MKSQVCVCLVLPDWDLSWFVGCIQQWAAFNHHRLLTLLQPQLQAQSWLLLASKSLSYKIPEGQDFRSCYLKPQQFSGLWFYKGFLLICFTFFGKGIRILKKPLGEQ